MPLSMFQSSKIFVDVLASNYIVPLARWCVCLCKPKFMLPSRREKLPSPSLLGCVLHRLASAMLTRHEKTRSRADKVTAAPKYSAHRTKMIYIGANCTQSFGIHSCRCAMEKNIKNGPFQAIFGPFWTQKRPFLGPHCTKIGLSSTFASNKRAPST